MDYSEEEIRGMGFVSYSRRGLQSLRLVQRSCRRVARFPLMTQREDADDLMFRQKIVEGDDAGLTIT